MTRSIALQINVAEDESEDQAVRRYMRAVVQSGVINKVRNSWIRHVQLDKRALAAAGGSSWRFWEFGNLQLQC